MSTNKTHIKQKGFKDPERPLIKELMAIRTKINNSTADMLLTFMLLG